MAETTDGFPYPPATDALGNGHQWMQDMAEFLDENYTPWTAYTPTISGLTLGDGTLDADYRRVFDAVEFRIAVNLGTTGTVTGALGVDFSPAGLPANETYDFLSDLGYPVGQVFAREADAPLHRIGLLIVDPASGNGYMYFDSSAAVAAATVPFTWGDNDVFLIRGSYRINP